MLEQIQNYQSNKKQWVCIWVFVLSALWLMLMIAVVMAPALPKMQIGEELPTQPVPEIHFEYNFDYKITINVNEEGVEEATIDPSWPLTVMLSSATSFGLGLLYNWLKSKTR